MKLGKRLTQIESMVGTTYTHIWDCCCDHGLLGASLLSRQATPCIHFVDIAPRIMAELEKKLHRFYPRENNPACASQWQVHCRDVATLPLQEFSGTHLIIIAGIGGELMAELLNALRKAHPATDIDFLLCPVNDSFLVRRQLIAFNFYLMTEALIVENQRCYEILSVSSRSTGDKVSEISSTGSLIWQTSTPEQFENATAYLHKILAHYQRMQLSGNTESKSIIEAYSAVSIGASQSIQAFQ